MSHIVEVDQSIKIEQSGATILAFSNGISHAIVIPSDVKTAAYRTLRSQGKSSHIAYLLLFAAGLYILLRDHLDQFEQVIIDVEYDGKDADIKAFLLRFVWKSDPKFEAEKIIFRRVGKKSPADQKARSVRERKDRNYRTVTKDEMLKIIG
jgi:hypothetical protein